MWSPAFRLRARRAQDAQSFNGLQHRACSADFDTADVMPVEVLAGSNGTVAREPLRTAPRQTATRKISAVTNIKGGVGKTTTAVNLAYLCAAGGRATLLWDLDPQGAATYTLRGEPLERTSSKKLLNGKRHLPELILSTGYPGLDLLPADFSYRNFDVHLSERKRPTEQLLKMSRPLRDVYSALFLDCAPGISLLSENVLRAADAIIVPLLPTPLSVRMLTQLRDFIIGEGWVDLMLLPFFSVVAVSIKKKHNVIADTREQFPMTLATEVPYWSEIERMSLRRAPIPAFAPNSAAAQIYAELWAEVTARMD